MNPSSPTPIVLFDGYCGLCGRVVQWIESKDRDSSTLALLPLQSEEAQALLKKHHFEGDPLQTIIVVDGQQLLVRSDAVIFIAESLGGVSSCLRLLKVLPRSLRDGVYRAVAANRYRIFGRYESCYLPKRSR